MSWKISPDFCIFFWIIKSFSSKFQFIRETGNFSYVFLPIFPNQPGKIFLLEIMHTSKGWPRCPFRQMGRFKFKNFYEISLIFHQDCLKILFDSICSFLNIKRNEILSGQTRSFSSNVFIFNVTWSANKTLHQLTWNWPVSYKSNGKLNQSYRSILLVDAIFFWTVFWNNLNSKGDLKIH